MCPFNTDCLKEVTARACLTVFAPVGTNSMAEILPHHN